MSNRKADPTPEADTVWDDLAQGSLSREEEAFLKALAEESEVAAVHHEAYAPLGEAFQARAASRVEEQLRVERHRRRFRHAARLTAVALAAAAAVLLFVVPGEPALPGYTLAVRGGTAEVRGPSAHEGPIQFDQRSRLTLVAQPTERVAGAVVATLVAVVGERAERVPARVELAESGALRLEVQGRDLPRSGTETLTLGIVIDRKQRSVREVQEMLQSGDPQVLRVRLAASSPGKDP